MKLYYFAAVACIGFLAGCEEKPVTVEEKRKVTVTEPAPPAAPAEGPAERVGKVIDRALEEAGQAVGEGLEKAGREVRESTDRFVPDDSTTQPSEP